MSPPKVFGLDGSSKLPFTCLGSVCPNTCCGPFHGTRALHATLKQADLGQRLGEESPASPHDRDVSVFAEIRLTPSDLKRIQSAGLDHLVVRRGSSSEPAHYMRLKADGTCAALSPDNMCGIHADRPTLCRAFPFYFDLFAGLSMVASCPGVGAGEQTVADLSTEILAATEMYDFWISGIRGNEKKK